LTEPITYDAQSFLIHGERVFLTAGAIHYPRIPRALWADRIQKAKAAGLNTLQLYFFWNVHEPEEGNFVFEGRADVAAFLDMIAEAGLWVVVRPGPYICAEWDGGGFPSWLYAKVGLETRTFNPLYLQAIENYWSRLLPIFAERQVTRGGKILLCQIENELNLGGNQGHAQELYMDALIGIARKYGIDVPLITCEGQFPGAIECINAHRIADRFEDYRRRQPDKPLHSTEFWTGWYNVWDKPLDTAPAWGGGDPFDPAFTERETWRILAMGGAGYTYYMWHGGTNFGYDAMYGQTTSYYSTGPLSETGTLHKKYGRTRRVALFAQTFGDILLNAPVYDPALHRQTLASGVLLHRREMEAGKLWFLENKGEERADVDLSEIAEGLPHHVTVPAFSVRPLVLDWSVGGTPMDFYAPIITRVLEAPNETIVVAYDPDSDPKFAATPGDPVHVRRHRTPAGRTQTFLTLTPGQMELAWFGADGTVYLGAYYLRESEEGLVAELLPGTTDLWKYAGGAWTQLPIPDTALPAAPVLEHWQSASADEEAQPGYDTTGWTAMYQPMNRVQLLDKSGYAWYRTTLHSDADGEATLTLTALADRALLLVNGELAAVSEAPAEERIADPSLTARVPLTAGENTVAVLSDDMGHLKGAWQFKGRRLEEDKKGLFGPVLRDFSTPLTNWRFRPKLSWEIAPGEVAWGPMEDAKRPLRLFRASFALPSDELAVPDREVIAHLDGMGKGVLYVNGINLGRYWAVNGHTRYYVPKCWLREHNELVLFEETDATPDGVRLAWDDLAIGAAVAL